MHLDVGRNRLREALQDLIVAASIGITPIGESDFWAEDIAKRLVVITKRYGKGYYLRKIRVSWGMFSCTPQHLAQID